MLPKQAMQQIACALAVRNEFVLSRDTNIIKHKRNPES